MKHRLWQFILAICLLAPPAGAQETLPPYHWANHYIDYLKVSGFLPELSFSCRPFDRTEIARQLLRIQRRDLQTRERDILRLLMREFAPELQLLGVQSDSEWGQLLKEALDYLKMQLLPESTAPGLKLGAYALPNAVNSSEDDSEVNIDLHSQALLSWNNTLTLYNNLRVFNHPPPTYIGKALGDFYSYNEQSYLHYRRGWFSAKLGRDFMQLGPGRSGQLLLSDNSRPFDMYQVRLENNALQLSFWGILLNERSLRDPQLLDFAATARRYINGHRIGVNLRDRLHIGLSEMIIYGGPNRNWDLGLVNPLNFYYAYVENLPAPSFYGNLFYQLDWDFYLRDGLELYGEFLLDDFQVDNKEAKDLEPAELAWMLGVNWSNPAAVRGALLNLEYVQIRNRTYNVLVNDWERLLHRGEEIGYFAGNNLERIGAKASYWFRADAYATLSASLLRQGEGSVNGPFNVEYLNFTPQEGYSEAFPFGVVENQREFSLSLFYKPYRRAHLEVNLANRSIDNYLHIEGDSFSDFSMRATLWLQWNRLWQLNGRQNGF